MFASEAKVFLKPGGPRVVKNKELADEHNSAAVIRPSGGLLRNKQMGCVAVVLLGR